MYEFRIQLLGMVYLVSTEHLPFPSRACLFVYICSSDWFPTCYGYSSSLFKFLFRMIWWNRSFQFSLCECRTGNFATGSDHQYHVSHFSFVFSVCILSFTFCSNSWSNALCVGSSFYAEVSWYQNNFLCSLLIDIVWRAPQFPIVCVVH